MNVAWGDVLDSVHVDALAIADRQVKGMGKGGRLIDAFTKYDLGCIVTTAELLDIYAMVCREDSDMITAESVETVIGFLRQIATTLAYGLGLVEATETKVQA